MVKHGYQPVGESLDRNPPGHDKLEYSVAGCHCKYCEVFGTPIRPEPVKWSHMEIPEKDQQIIMEMGRKYEINGEEVTPEEYMTALMGIPARLLSYVPGVETHEK